MFKFKIFTYTRGRYCNVHNRGQDKFAVIQSENYSQILDKLAIPALLPQRKILRVYSWNRIIET